MKTSPEIQGEWFTGWFGSRYYDLLYRHRNDAEAENFIRFLHRHLGLPPHASVLDLACGAGRHSRTLHALGYQVTGIDLSADFIRKARELSPAGIRFETGDMREPFGDSGFDAVLNLFTSFGYFSNPEDNRRVLSNVFRALKPGGMFVLDFLNAGKVVRDLVPEEETVADGVRFQVRRNIENGFIRKHIRVQDGDSEFSFEECVQLLDAGTLRVMTEDAGMNVLEMLGDYEGGTYDDRRSPRVILIAAKPGMQ